MVLQQRKFTLLSRPQQQLSSSVSLSYPSSLSSSDTYNGQVIEYVFFIIWGYFFISLYLVININK